MFLKSLLLSFTIIASLVTSEAIAVDTITKDIHWLDLLHYKDGKSLISDKTFFLSKDGNTSPEKELQANLDRLSNEIEMVCKFPARVTYLQKNHINFSPAIPLKECKQLSEYLKNLSATEAFLIFATEKINSPLSMMGHIFLRIDGEQANYKPSHSLSFFANLSSIQNNLSFIPKSLTSGTDGLYILEPYEKRSSIYIDKENRKLVPFKLRLTNDQLELLVYHIWEMKAVNVAYNLKSHNCASALATLLSVVDDEYADTSYKNFITPTDLINEALSQNLLEDSINQNELIIENHSIKKSRSSHVKANFGYNDDVSFINLNYSFAYQDIMDFHERNSNEFEVKLMSVDLNIISNKIHIEKATIFKTKLFVPSTLTNLSTSTGFEISFDNENSSIEHSSLAPHLIFSKGISLDTRAKKAFLPYSFIDLMYTYSDGNTFVIAPEIGFISYMTNTDKLKMNYKLYNSNNVYKYKENISIKYAKSLNHDRLINLSFQRYKNNDNNYSTNVSIGMQFNF